MEFTVLVIWLYRVEVNGTFCDATVEVNGTFCDATQNAKKHERKGMDNTGGFGKEKSA
ncbi:hypothetical protein LTSEJOH_1302 [Salmonella enterica subsp. enterica serovar Johannesburg str. S5-703]|nr:hypothetical protein LTSEJOH_1302 [Salmonella enterica subsp. enterica serovar Johannesburg str. S5-703]